MTDYSLSARARASYRDSTARVKYQCLATTLWEESIELHVSVSVYLSSLQAATSEPKYSMHFSRSIGPLPTTFASRKSVTDSISRGCSVAGGSGRPPSFSMQRRSCRSNARRCRRGDRMRASPFRDAALDGDDQFLSIELRRPGDSRRRASAYPSCARPRPSHGRTGNRPCAKDPHARSDALRVGSRGFGAADPVAISTSRMAAPIRLFNRSFRVAVHPDPAPLYDPDF